MKRGVVVGDWYSVSHTVGMVLAGASQHELRKLIAGPTVHICNECIELCIDIIGEDVKASLTKSRDVIAAAEGNLQGPR